MNKLIKNELIKVFKKKSLYITLMVVLAFVVLTNCIYKFSFHNGETHFYSEDYIQQMKEELSQLDPNKLSDSKMYIDLKTTIDIYEMMQQFEEGSWQEKIVSSQISSYVNEKNMYLYGEVKDTKKVAEMEAEIQKVITKLEEGDWKYFAKKDLEEAKNSYNQLVEQRNNTEDKKEIQELDIGIESAKINEEVAQIRLDREIAYGSDYKNIALEKYQRYSNHVLNMEHTGQELKYEEKREYNNYLENREINKYILQNDVDVNKQNDIRGILKGLFDEYGLFIIVMVVMIAGTIVSEEFNKGTVKLLLVKPYSRNKILLAKFITVLMMIAFFIVSVILMELVVGGIIFGYDSLSVPILQYNFTTQSLEAISIFPYLGIMILTQLPKIILLATLAFACSTLFTNSAVAVALPLLGYMSADIINMLVLQYKVDFMRFFVSLNWNFEEYLGGNLPSMEGMTFIFSIMICLLYFMIMIIPTFISFKKKNIKNI